MIRKNHFIWRDMVSGQAWITVWIPIIVISALHYYTNDSIPWLHDIFRRLFYIPIVLAGFAFGVRGAIASSVTISLLYFPHAFTRFFYQDPADGTEKILEIILYFAVAIIVGRLADKEFDKRVELSDKSQKLTAALSMAHEMKSPLTGILTFIEDLVEESDKNDPKRQDYEVIQREAIRSKEIATNMLEFGRQQPPNLVSNDANEIVRRALQVIVRTRRFANIEIKTNLGHDPERILCDATQMQQVLTNLMNNGAEAMPEGGVLEISTGATLDGTEVEIKIKDNGVGMKPEAQQKLFRPFFSTKGGKNSGLGLSIVKGIVDRHHGKIRVESEIGHGTVFIVVLPAAKG